MQKLLPDKEGFISIHGMKPGKIMEITDPTEIHALIGLGKYPSENSRSVAERLVAMAQQYGIRALIGNDSRFMEVDLASGVHVVGDDGEPARRRLAALGKESSTNFARETFDEIGLDHPALQLELTRAIRLLPADMEWHPDRKALIMGVYVGYLFCKDAVSLVSAHE